MVPALLPGLPEVLVPSATPLLKYREKARRARYTGEARRGIAGPRGKSDFRGLVNHF